MNVPNSGDLFFNGITLMSKLEFTTLNITDINEVMHYEKALYRAFSSTDIKTLDEIWDFDIPNKRINTKIPYRSQEVFIAKLGGVIIAGAAVNFNMREKLQLEIIGFSIDKTEKHICEGLGIFSLQVFSGINPVALQLRDFSYDILDGKGIKKVYGTCSQRRLKGYQVQMLPEKVEGISGTGF
jgi:hypothetical protein